MNEVKTSILRTLVYSDIFDYPLTKEELWRFLISEKSVQRKEFEGELSKVSGVKLVHLEGGHFYCLFGRREEIVRTRIKKLKDSKKKIINAKKIIRYLSFIPTVLFIGISGGLALENSEKNDDIDLFAITSKNTLWITRLILVFLLIIMGQYRGRGRKESQKVCLNMLIDEQYLAFPKSRHDLYTAHEIAQLMPVFDRNDIYQKFINANKWVDLFLPNARGTKLNNTRNHTESFFSVFLRFVLRLSAIEQIVKTVQLLYMQKYRTIETISDHFLAFHPFDYGEYVLKEYKKKLRRYSLL